MIGLETGLGGNRKDSWPQNCPKQENCDSYKIPFGMINLSYIPFCGFGYGRYQYFIWCRQYTIKRG